MGMQDRPVVNDQPVERLASLRLELQERLEEERQAQVILFHSRLLRDKCSSRARRAEIAVITLEKQLGDRHLTIVARDDEPLNDPAALARFSVVR